MTALPITPDNERFDIKPSGHIPARSNRRVTWVDASYPATKLSCLFNPRELPFSKSATYGELSPIGWSQQVTNYSHTESIKYDLTLEFSYQAAQKFQYEALGFDGAISFFNSFLHTDAIGHAPSLIIMVWPKVAMIVSEVRRVSGNYTRFDNDMNALNYSITLSLSEYRRSFLKNDTPGLLTIDKAVVGNAAAAAAQRATGRSMKISR